MTLIQLKYAVTVAGEASLNVAAKKLYISQPSLTAAIHLLEDEIGIELFARSKSGIKVTAQGREFIGYAQQVLDQYELLHTRYVEKKSARQKCSVSLQHYTFAVNAFINVIKRFGMEHYEFALYETKTHEVIENVKNHKSEVGVLYINNFNRQVLEKLFRANELVFTPFLSCGIYVYLAKSHPLANKAQITLDELAPYPCLAFDQGERNSFYFAEEVLSTWHYDRIIRASDRATMLNLMKGVHGFTLCSGIICEELNGSDYSAVRLASDELMHIGYLVRRDAILSELAKEFIVELKKCAR